MPTRPSLAVLMDPLETIKPAKDSTLAMLKAAAKRGLETLVFGQGDLWSRDGRAFARLTPIELTGRIPFPTVGELPYFITLPPYGFYWFTLVDPEDDRIGEGLDGRLEP